MLFLCFQKEFILVAAFAKKTAVYELCICQVIHHSLGI